ncbi:GNAT family N-acetyltransferase [Heyndrickxia sp. NPDC080065]|uniref:GNAT family N-acetyltransferase n=1 Tax=Heyndrickxia sp. NPDC080065 TaxID=3390568 RepID=UPI003D0197FE
MADFKRYDDLFSFKKDTFPYLEKNEVVNNLIMGLLKNGENVQPTLMATLIKEKEIILVLLQTDPERNIILSHTNQVIDKELETITHHLIEELKEAPGLEGDRNLVLKLGEKLSTSCGIQFEIRMKQKIYKLEKVKKAPIGVGALRKVNLTDLPIISEWVYQFCVDVNEPITVEDARKKAEEVINRQRLYAWEIDGKMVSMANATRPTQNNITISLVYTPADERKKGYASNCVSALSQFMLDQGYKTTSLYTDLDNPTSNKIYMEIGYEEVAESIVIRKH